MSTLCRALDFPLLILSEATISSSLLIRKWEFGGIKKFAPPIPKQLEWGQKLLPVLYVGYVLLAELLSVGEEVSSLAETLSARIVDTPRTLIHSEKGG